MSQIKKLWSNGSFSVDWLNDDEVIITDHTFADSNKEPMVCVMDGGDFEYILSGLIMSYRKGIIHGIRRAEKIIKGDK